MTEIATVKPAEGRCVLVIHRVVASAMERDHDLSRKAFEHLLDGLIEAGCKFAADLAREPHDGAVVVTFDDATSDHRLAAEVLTERGIPAIFFVPAGKLGAPSHLDAPALAVLVGGGHVIGSHGWSHLRLDRLDEAALATEIVESRAALEDITGAPVKFFAPAGGIGFASLPQRLEAAGYVASRSTRWGIYGRPADRWRIPTVPVTSVTLGRGWVVAAATGHRLPAAMTALRLLRGVLGHDARSRLRAVAHRR